MLNKLRPLSLSFVLLFCSFVGLASVKWNEYHNNVMYFNYEGQNIILKNLPFLPLDRKLNMVDIRGINLCSWVSMEPSLSSALDSLFRQGLLEKYGLCINGRVNSCPLSFKLYDKRIEIQKRVDSYLVYTMGIYRGPAIFLVNVHGGCIQSILEVSGRVSIEKKDALIATIQKGRIDLFENGYYSKVNGKRYVSNQSRHLTSYGLDKQGMLSTIKNYCLLLYQRRYRVKGGTLIKMRQSDTLEYANYYNKNIFVPDLPKMQVISGERIDIKTVISTPTSSFTREEVASIGPAICRDNWSENSFYWLNRLRSNGSIKSYLVLVIGIEGNGASRVFMVNFKGNHITSVVNASYFGSKLECFPYRHSKCRKGSITIYNDYGEKAVSPIRVVRDYSESKYDIEEDIMLSDIDEKYDVIHDFNLYESNMPKSSKYVLLLDKDGYLTRK